MYSFFVVTVVKSKIAQGRDGYIERTVLLKARTARR